MPQCLNLKCLAVDEPINNQDFDWPIITNNTLTRSTGKVKGLIQTRPHVISP